MKYALALLLAAQGEPAPKIEKGEMAPAVELQDEEGRTVKLADQKGKKNVLLAFYPKDFTKGWTRELKELRDSLKKFEDAETVILGISMDGVESHKKFCGELTLNFPLLSDPDRKAHKGYGFENMVRALILIDKDGMIRFVNRKYDLSKEQTDALMAEVAALKPK